MKSLKSESPKSPRSPSIELTSTEDDDSFKTKFENLKILVQHLKKELRYQRQRSEGLQSIAKCLEEERDENISLRSIITNLQQRHKEVGLIDNRNVKSENTKYNINELNTRRDSNGELRIKTLEGQVGKLNAQLDDVTQMNTRWQQYNQQREELMAQKDAQIEILKEGNSKLEKLVHAKEMDKAKIDAMIYDYQQKISIYKEDLEQFEEENKRYQGKYHQMQENIMHLEKANAYLAKELKRVKERPSSTDTSEKIQMLEAQIRICTEDFESERRDRERAVAKITELEKTVRQLKTEKDVLLRQHMDRIQRRRQQAVQGYEQSYQASAHSPYQPPGHHIKLVPHGPYQTDGEGDSNANEGFDEIDEGGFSSGLPSLTSAEDHFTSSVKAENKLQCPKCSKEFPVVQHLQLVEHMNKCCK